MIAVLVRFRYESEFSEAHVRQHGRQAGNTFVDGLLALARHSRNWIRPVAVLKPQKHNTRRQFASLTRHLFAKWPVPAYMDSVWFLGNGRGAVQQQEWFLHVGRGQNIRTADLPLPYTKRMAHHFMQAPADLTVEAALRWARSTDSAARSGWYVRSSAHGSGRALGTMTSGSRCSSFLSPTRCFIWPTSARSSTILSNSGSCRRTGSLRPAWSSAEARRSRTSR
jgi:hypothetical protein